jgi:lysophospholipase L1-like esterase
MARHRFGGIADYVITLGETNAATLQPGTPVTCWNAASGGTQYADLVDLDGTTVIAGGELVADAVGALPEFLGPDGVRSVYLDANGGAGPRRRAVAVDVGEDLTVVEAQVSGHAAALNPHGTGIATLADTAANPTTADVKGGGVLTYDTTTSSWRSDGTTSGLMGWHAALAGRHYARATIVALGDSITEGQGATAFSSTWPARLRALLRHRFPTDGVVGGGRGFIGAASTGTLSYAWPTSVTGGPDLDSGWGPKRYAVFLDGAAPADTLTYALQGTAADIMWGRSEFSGSFRYRVDGGSWTTVSTGGATQDGMLTRVNLGASGPHELHIEAVDATFKQIIAGVVEYDGDEDAGLVVHECAHFGWSSTTWVGGTTAPARWPSAIGALSPDLVVIMLGANDQWAGTEPSVFRSNLSALIGALRAATVAPIPYPPILLAMHAARGDGPFAHAWSAYTVEAHAIARTDPMVSVVDLTVGPRFPDQGASPSWGLYADAVHLSDTGLSYVADQLAALLAPR